jgi:Ethanolamine ammonia-lyase light chain (EutC)
VLGCLRPLFGARRLTVAPIVLVEQGRVAIGDEIGELLDAKLAVVLLGGTPGSFIRRPARRLCHLATAGRHDGFEPELHIEYPTGRRSAGIHALRNWGDAK